MRENGAARRAKHEKSIALVSALSPELGTAGVASYRASPSELGRSDPPPLGECRPLGQQPTGLADETLPDWQRGLRRPPSQARLPRSSCMSFESRQRANCSKPRSLVRLTGTEEHGERLYLPSNWSEGGAERAFWSTAIGVAAQWPARQFCIESAHGVQVCVSREKEGGCDRRQAPSGAPRRADEKYGLDVARARANMGGSPDTRLGGTRRACRKGVL